VIESGEHLRFARGNRATRSGSRANRSGNTFSATVAIQLLVSACAVDLTHGARTERGRTIS
jgi:hypothetical protein